MKPNPSKRSIRARRRNLQRDLELDVLARHEYFHLEPWQREPIDPDVRHVVTVETRVPWPNGRAACTCGLDTGWLPLWDAEQRASWHRRGAETFTPRETLESTTPDSGDE